MEKEKNTKMNALQTQTCQAGVQLSACLRRQGQAPMTPCGGHGNCGKCIVRVIRGELKISTMDRVHLSEEQLQQGYRLACQAMPESEVTVEFTAFHSSSQDTRDFSHERNA